MIEQLILVRHGETVHNAAGITQGWNDSALSEVGMRQVARLAERIAELRPTALFSSSLERAVTTARAIGEATGLEVQLLDELREMNYGGWEGRSFLDLRRQDEAVYQEWIKDPDCPCPDGESHHDVLRRMQRALEIVGERVDGQPARVVLVSHGTALRIAATALLDVPVMTSRHLAVDNAAVSIFLHRRERWVLKLWNDSGPQT
jgi:broad specificity phosphatase PhoE